MTNKICINCQDSFDANQKDRIMRNINQSLLQFLPDDICLTCIMQNLANESGAAYIKVKEMQKVHEQAKLAYQQAYDTWKASIADYNRIDHSKALIKHLLDQENKSKQIRKTSSKKLSEQEIVEAMLGALTEEQRAALSNIIQSGAIK